ncbi:MAG: prepilin-type N-terminal cleavage/methylation domain-containing protein [Gallionella sp.]|nr:prepilin-type N-terminal cleavage/methylation domain-containing protein [Gallionella sp.]
MSKQTGFTLIEMLVALLIMGLLIGLVSVIAQPDDKALLRVEAERLAQLLELAATESRITGKPIAWTSDGSDYRFWRFAENPGWSEIANDDFLRARSLPQGMKISNMRTENLRSPAPMRVEFDSYSGAPSFSVEISIGASRYTVENSPIGAVRVFTETTETSDERI